MKLITQYLEGFQANYPDLYTDFRPKIYRGVDNFGDYRIPHLHWMAAHWKLSKEAGRYPEEAVDLITAYEGKTAHEYDFPAFFVKRDFFNACAASSIHYAIDWRNEYLPFPAFTFVLPRSNVTGFACISCFMRIKEDGERQLHISGYPDGFIEASEKILRTILVVPFSEEAIDSSLTSFLERNIDLGGWQQDAAIHSTEAGTIKLQAETAALMVRDYDEIMAKLRLLHSSVMMLENEKHGLQMANYEKDRLIDKLRAGETNGK